ncbi:MAG: DUF362 domain-containing protein [Candidatus Nezhaarchaeales archaeon]
MDRVSVVKVQGSVEKAVFKAVGLLEPLNLDLKQDSLILFKPNVCFHVNFSGAVVTDLRVVEAAIKYFKGLNCRMMIAETDNMTGSAEKRCASTGFIDLANKLNIPFINLSKDEKLENFPLTDDISIGLPKTALEADLIVNLPKMKTSAFSGPRFRKDLLITIAMKNVFGLIASGKKQKYHKVLDDVIILVNQLLKKQLVIVDGVIAMEGNGPIHGDPVNLNLIVAGLNPVSVDAVCCSIMGLNPQSCSYLKKASEKGMGEIDVSKVEIVGEPLNNVRMKFKCPEFDVRSLLRIVGKHLKYQFKPSRIRNV